LHLSLSSHILRDISERLETDVHQKDRRVDVGLSNLVAEVELGN
jgi:hypothetical protein